mmetsp:Transcript_14866/g.29157  ORF Transcript_14866/g.29157 Transcript_14866/m.29157 type:complete len:248 (-) Transcript_14866:740-1483(-)
MEFLLVNRAVVVLVRFCELGLHRAEQNKVLHSNELLHKIVEVDGLAVALLVGVDKVVDVFGRCFISHAVLLQELAQLRGRDLARMVGVDSHECCLHGFGVQRFDRSRRCSGRLPVASAGDKLVHHLVSCSLLLRVQGAGIARHLARFQRAPCPTVAHNATRSFLCVEELAVCMACSSTLAADRNVAVSIASAAHNPVLEEQFCIAHLVSAVLVRMDHTLFVPQFGWGPVVARAHHKLSLWGSRQDRV